MTTTILTTVDGVRVVVPACVELITPCVLREQLDGFEDELRVMLTLLKPGNRVVDVGPNHVVYSLSMAKAVRPAGRAWAFEAEMSPLVLDEIRDGNDPQLHEMQCRLSLVQQRARISLAYPS